MFLIYSRETGEPLTPEADKELRSRHQAVMEDASRRGVLKGAEPLKPTSTATTVRMTEQGPLLTDGPFAETKEQLAGYYIIECADLDEALEWGKRIPSGCRGAEGCIEIRPVGELKKRPVLTP
jgi:hypothetical protein